MKRIYPRGARFSMSDVPDDIERIAIELLPEDHAIARGILYRKKGTQPRVGALMLHPRMDQSQSYILLSLMKAGYAALGCAGRFVHNDTAAIQEHLLLDAAAGVRALREHGCEQIVLVGNSGGAGLLSFYQSEARRAPEARITQTASGAPFPLAKYDLPPADGLVFIAGHPGEASRLAHWLDPSVTDENDPLSVDPSLDMYDPSNGFRIPPEPSKYSENFLARFREAQKARADRLDRLARSRLAARAEAAEEAERLEAQGDLGERWRELARRASLPEHLTIARVLACPEWVDPTIEPDDRDLGSFNNDPRPDLQNYEGFIANFLTPEAFLSTWSAPSSQEDAYENLPAIPDPLLVVHYAGDAASRLSEARRYLEVSGATDKEFVLVPKADHWGFQITGPNERGPRTTEGTDAIVRWLRERFPLD
jgi:pimeloyl-ACP methyl ester carboxylesterase